MEGVNRTEDTEGFYTERPLARQPVHRMAVGLWKGVLTNLLAVFDYIDDLIG